MAEDTPMTIDVVEDVVGRDTPIRAILTEPLAPFKIIRYVKEDSQTIGGIITAPTILAAWKLVSNTTPDIFNSLPFGFNFGYSMAFKGNVITADDSIVMKFQKSPDNTTWTDIDSLSDADEGGESWDTATNLINPIAATGLSTSDGSTVLYFRLIAYKAATNDVSISNVDFWARQILYGHISLVRTV